MAKRVDESKLSEMASSSNKPWHTIRVFVSSTFRDMQAERNHLVRFVFPRLQEELLRYRIHLLDVDLRWGVTNEQNALEVCREIIDECRPRFICILGGRYGYVPPQKNYSITADEVHYGVLDRKLTERGFAYFYFRDDCTTYSMVERVPGEFREPPESNNQKKLAQLKQTIIDQNLKPYTYSARWDNQSRMLTGLQAFGNRVHDDLLGSIKSDPTLHERFSKWEEKTDEFSEENASVEAFIEKHRERFVLGSRESVFKQLITHATASTLNGYVCVIGSSGSGKSALLAYLYRILTSSPDYSEKMLVIGHFVGSSPASTDLRRTLKRLCHELKAGCPQITSEIPEEFEELRACFDSFLLQAAKFSQVVILLDAINQFDSKQQSIGLQWLPEELPPKARVIFSTIDLSMLKDLEHLRFKPIVFELNPLTEKDGQVIIQQFSRRYRKNFEANQSHALLSKTDADKPLYLLAALEQLRTLGTYEEITNQINQLPPDTYTLFLWIMKRLENDEGFRDAAGQHIGRELISSFASLMSASRFGLSYRELGELIAFGKETDPHGNIAALLRLLRPYLMRRGEQIDFYHNQLRLAAAQTWLKTEAEKQNVNSQLAIYFRQKAKPDNSQLWEKNLRALTELPYHLEQAHRDEELRELFTDLPYLVARVATGQVYEQISDYSLIRSSLTPTLKWWHNFLQKNAQKLTAYPDMLVALVNHEGASEIREEALRVSWAQPWLRTITEPMPPPRSTKTANGLRGVTTEQLKMPNGPKILALAPQRQVAFCFESLGAIRLYDLKNMQQTSVVLSISRSRPLIMECAPDAASLAVFNDNGKAQLYRCIFGSNQLVLRLELAAEFSFYLPESEDPIVVFHQGAFWYQKSNCEIANISTATTQTMVLSIGHSGELSSLVFVDGQMFLTLRQCSNTLLLIPGVASLKRENTDVTGSCWCGGNNVAVAFSDGTLAVFQVADALSAKKELHVGFLKGSLGWDGNRLLWFGQSSGFYAWRPKEDEPQVVNDNQEIFPPTHLFASPQKWYTQLPGQILLSTKESIIKFSFHDIGASSDDFLETQYVSFFGGLEWRLVYKDKEEYLLIERQPLREVLLDVGVLGRLYCALDGGKLFASSGQGVGAIFNLADLTKTYLQNCPLGLNSVVGDHKGGFWLTDRVGDIYFAGNQGQCFLLAKTGLNGASRSSLLYCGNILVWYGYSYKYFEESGGEPARTFLFFRKTGPLQQISQQHRHPKEGLCLSAAYDKTNNLLVTLWCVDGKFLLRTAVLEDFIDWKFHEISVEISELHGFENAALSADGKFLGIINSSGSLTCVSVKTGKIMGDLGPSKSFVAIASGGSGSDFWLLDSGKIVYKCIIVESNYAKL